MARKEEKQILDPLDGLQIRETVLVLFPLLQENVGGNTSCIFSKINPPVIS